MLVTKKAPDFTATTVLADGSIVDNFNLYENLGEKVRYFSSTHLTLLLFVHLRSLHSHTESKSSQAEVLM